MAFPLNPATTSPMEAHIAEKLPAEPGWQYEPKWDGFRCLAFRDGADVALYGKSGKPLTAYFPEIAAALAATRAKRFVLDGELVIVMDGRLSFSALQARLHPAESRRRKLAAETPALLILFDLLADKTDARGAPLTQRRQRLEVAMQGEGGRLVLSPFTSDLARARAWLAKAGQGAVDGVIAKPAQQPYAMGERKMLKIKKMKTADCVVGGFRYASRAKEVGSLLLGLFNAQGKLDHVGFTSGISAAERPLLTRKLEKLRGGPGFTGDAPGGPSRWSTERSAEWVPLKTKLVAEVRYDHVSESRFRHGTKFLRWRPDRVPQSCTFDQLSLDAAPSPLVASLLTPGKVPAPRPSSLRNKSRRRRF